MRLTKRPHMTGDYDMQESRLLSIQAQGFIGADCRRDFLPPIVGSLFSWKSLLTNRRTREDCKQRMLSSAINSGTTVGGQLYLAYGGLSQQYKLDAATRLWGVYARRLGHC